MKNTRNALMAAAAPAALAWTAAVQAQGQPPLKVGRSLPVIVGAVHSGVALALARAVKVGKTMLLMPNAGAVAGAITGPLCALLTFVHHADGTGTPRNKACAPGTR